MAALASAGPSPCARPPPRTDEGGIPVQRRRIRTVGALGTLVTTALLAASCSSPTGTPGASTSGTSTGAGGTGSSQTTSFTGIDPGAGLRYSYAPSVVQTSTSTRDVFYCGNSKSGDVIDHVYLSVGHLRHGRWQYGSPSVVLAPKSGTFYSEHTCEPQVLSGKFRFGGKPYTWVMFFTAESAPTNSTNTIGMAFANSVGGPYVVDPSPLITPADDFGTNSYPNNCPTYSTGTTYYCVGEPTATTIGDGHIVLSYMGNSGSPGSVSHFAEGQVAREIDLSNVPATGQCRKCILPLPTGKRETAVSDHGLGKWWFHNSSIAYDPREKDIVVSFDNGPPDTTKDAPPVTPVVTVAKMPLATFLDGRGKWQVLDNFGQCLSGYTDNHNTGIVQTSNGDLPGGPSLTVMYTIADDNLKVNWGVWDYRLWTTQVPLSGGHPSSVPSEPAASAACPGLDVVRSTGSMTVSGSAQSFGSAKTSAASAPIVGMALTRDRQGYFLVAKNGKVTAFGDAHNQGSARDVNRSSSVVGIALDVTTGGYWIAESNGVVQSFGASRVKRVSTTSTSGPIVAIAGLPNGAGFYLVSKEGDVYPFGNALSYGNMSVPAGQSVTTLVTTPNGLGYYVATGQGTLGAFGDAQLYGPATVPVPSRLVGLAVDLNGFGYWTIDARGQLSAFGNAGGTTMKTGTSTDPIVSITAS